LKKEPAFAGSFGAIPTIGAYDDFIGSR